MFNAAEQLKHEGPTVGCQGGIRRVKERAGEIRGEGHEGLKGLWNERGERQEDLVIDALPRNMVVIPAVIPEAKKSAGFTFYRTKLFFFQLP